MKITPPTANPPSRKRTKVIVAALIAVSVAGLAWLLLHTCEPSYNGKPFTLWLEECHQLKGSSEPASEEQQKAMKALGQMGTNAIPIIFRTLEGNDSPMRNKYREVWSTLPAFLKMVLPQPKPENFSVDEAIGALFQFADANPVEQLRSQLKSGNPAVREAAASVVLGHRPKWLSTKDETSLCISLLRDLDPAVRWESAMALGELGPAASNAVPALIASLQASEAGRNKLSTFHSRAAAAKALGSIGPAAASSVPALTNLLPSADTYLRVQIASAVWNISSEKSIALPILISDCPGLDSPTKWSAISTLGEMGPRAKAAIPMLLNELTNSKNDAFILAPITNALKAIDPEAAAKAGVK
ncbi:HEAT repeat domain-containing protein [Pedosphaera parvula]|uniref:PBS lyase HEAT domain protein repeat-containing protein n=1 Tax=Pedosphaera parvula (strain Ellin514) TaxID=320771 RepID=B9XS73_PEDPL|nr:HEAT repeat domain-containing protein [Pedosphaera parvula]EEF57328.1 PBS lyase HEAT domain protein repeat-containing protein [Pedosphaera parvula Ellin514]